MKKTTFVIGILAAVTMTSCVSLSEMEALQAKYDQTSRQYTLTQQELLEIKDKRYWAVRTSIRTLVYGFDGGAPLTGEEGGKMIRPDSQLTPTSRGGLTVDCYDGKTRDIKL